MNSDVKMRWQYFPYTPILLLAMSCLSSGEISSTSDSKKVSDQPMTVNLGLGMVSRRNENLTTSSLVMEGGTLNITLINKTTTSLPIISTVTETKNPKSNSTPPVLPGGGTMTDAWPDSSNDKNSSIKARKGVSPNVDDTNSTPVSCECCIKNITVEQLKNCTCCQIEPKPSSTSSPVTKQVENKSTDVDVNVTKTTAMDEVTPVPTMVPSPVPHHHKPNVTSDVPEQQVPPKQEDYVIPVVGIIFAIPLIIILGALVYKKGADLWERRHYRRMDFLIDGIYNQ